ncbi:MAG: hypothetical protein H5T41_06375 [Methanomassiliicoccales archaeon]|nr:hypothetical protein [Methanomassiliicoccales archaeon]
MAMIRKKIVAIALAIVIVAGLVSAETTWHIISNIFRGQTEVEKAQLLTIYPDSSTPFPTITITGQPFNITIDVENPNPVTINGWIMINFTKAGITLNDVSVFSDAKYEGYWLCVNKKGVYGDTLVFIISVNSLVPSDPYFHFRPGLNDNITYFTVQYNAEGTYNWELAVIQ